MPLVSAGVVTTDKLEPGSFTERVTGMVRSGEPLTRTWTLKVYTPPGNVPAPALAWKLIDSGVVDAVPDMALRVNQNGTVAGSMTKASLPDVTDNATGTAAPAVEGS